MGSETEYPGAERRAEQYVTVKDLQGKAWKTVRRFLWLFGLSVVGLLYSVGVFVGESIAFQREVRTEMAAQSDVDESTAFAVSSLSETMAAVAVEMTALRRDIERIESRQE